MKPISEDQAAALALDWAKIWHLTAHQSQSLTSFVRRVYGEGRLAGTQELGAIVKNTLANLDNVGRRKGNLLR